MFFNRFGDIKNLKNIILINFQIKNNLKYNVYKTSF